MRKILKNYSGLPKEVYLIFICRIINCIGAFIHPLMSLILTDKIGISIKDAGFFLSMLSIMQGPSIILGGYLADKVGRKKTLFIFQSLGGIIYIICGFVEPSMSLAYLIVVASCLFSASAPSLDALNADVTTEENRKISYSLIYLGVNLGFAIGPFLGGLLYENYLKFIFIGDACTSLIALALIMIFIKEKNLKNTENDIKELEGEEESSVFSVLIKRPQIIIFSIGMLIFQFGYSQFGFAVPIHLEGLFNAESGVKMFGGLCALNAVLVVVLTPLIVYFTEKKNPCFLMSVGGLFYGIAFFILSCATGLTHFILFIILLTIGEVFIATNSSTFVANMSPKSHRGRISGVLPLIYGAGYSIGPALMGSLLSITSINVSWLIVSAILILGGGVMYINKFVVIKYFEKVEN